MSAKMKPQHASAALGLCLGVMALPAAADSLVLTNAKIHTVNRATPKAEAIAIDERGIITAVGPAGDVLAVAGKHCLP